MVYLSTGKTTKRNSLQCKTLDGSIAAIDSINSSTVLNGYQESVESRRHQEKVTAHVAVITPENGTQQPCLLHMCRHDEKSAMAGNEVATKSSIHMAHLEIEEAIHTPEKQSVSIGALSDITIYEERLLSVELQELVPSIDTRKELDGTTHKELSTSIEESYPFNPLELLETDISKTTEQVSRASRQDPRHEIRGVSATPGVLLPPKELLFTITIPSLCKEAFENARETLDTTLSRDQSVDQASKAVDDTGVMIECVEEASPRAAAPEDLINPTTEGASNICCEVLEPVTLRIISQRKTDVIMHENAAEGLRNAREVEGMSSDMETSLPVRRTRSRARFSDDTNMLKEFLNRAQAKKAAKPQEEAIIAFHGQILRRSPRKVLGQLDRNSPSPSKPRDSTPKPGSPPAQNLLDLLNSDEDDGELRQELKSRHRTTHTCPSVPTTQCPPTSIPVRRPDGSEPIVLLKSAAQELAITTRANTRRNKGSSKLPKLVLESLMAAVVEIPPVIKNDPRSTKSVGWDKNLVYFRESVGKKEGKKEKEGKAKVKSKAKSHKALGATNDSPAPKKDLDKAKPSNGLPAPRRRGKPNS